MLKDDKDIRYYLNKSIEDREKHEKDRQPLIGEKISGIGPNNNYELLNVFYIEKRGYVNEEPIAYMIRDLKKGRARIYTKETALTLISSVSFARAIKNVRVKVEDGQACIVSLENYPDVNSDFYKVIIKNGKLDKELSQIATITYLNYIEKNKIQTKMISFGKYIQQYFLGL